MSAIWGIVMTQPEQTAPEYCRQLFESAYQSSCKINRYESACMDDACFGCGIQYITAESERECLPIVNKERGILFTADCILDNRTELIRLLHSAGHSEKELLTAPDGTLMYLAYLALGNDCVSHLRGLFSFAVWQEHTRTLTLFSDPVAARSLYYIQKDGLFAFSTRMEPLLKLFPDVTPNIDYCKDFLLAPPSVIYVVPGETPYRDIFLMQPATRLQADAAGAAATVYRIPEHSKPSRMVSAGKTRTRFLSLYRDCVRDALRTSGEVGIALSSGLDSSGIAALAAQELAKSKKRLHSYTFVPHLAHKPSQNRNVISDEAPAVKKLAEQYPNLTTTFLDNNGKNLFDDMALCASILEMPYKTGAFPNHYEMCAAGASVGCKVFLNGGFGNNTVSFGHIRNGLYHLYHKKRWVTFFSQLNGYAKHEQISRKQYLCDTMRLFRKFQRQTAVSPTHFIPANRFLLPAIKQDYPLQSRFMTDPRHLLSEGFLTGDTYPAFLQATSLLMYLGVFETQFGLATGMVLRDPTKDVRMIDFCRSLPFSIFTRRGTPRWLMRSSFQTLLPSSFLDSWAQHGILNADWIDRIYRDWDRLKPELLNHLNCLPEHCINKKELKTLLESFATAPLQHADDFVHFCAFEGLFRFFRP